jgi:hypothetical protein
VGSFSRDVLVNVVANLIAAAVIYLLGAMLGIFPVYWRLIIPILGILTYVIMLNGYVAALRARRPGTRSRHHGGSPTRSGG